MIHGGGWNGGDKVEFNEYIDTLKKNLPQYAIFNINYRLSAAGNLLAAQDEDINAALQFISDKIPEYHISQKVVLMGASAGAHLALLHAYKHPDPHIKAVVDFFGPTDLVDGYNHSPNSLLPLQLIEVIGQPEEQDPELYRQFSPLEFVTPSAPPTIILHGGDDLLVSVNQSVLLKQKLDAAGVINKLIIYPSEGHGWTGSNLIDSFNQIINFLVHNVN
jgi:acetyl esterase/lipase